MLETTMPIKTDYKLPVFLRHFSQDLAVVRELCLRLNTEIEKNIHV